MNLSWSHGINKMCGRCFFFYFLLFCSIHDVTNVQICFGFIKYDVSILPFAKTCFVAFIFLFCVCVYHHRSIGANMYMNVWTLPLLSFPAQFLEFCLFLWPKIATKTKTEYWLSSKRYSMLFFCFEFRLFASSCMRPWHQQQNSSILQFEFE